MGLVAMTGVARVVGLRADKMAEEVMMGATVVGKMGAAAAVVEWDKAREVMVTVEGFLAVAKMVASRVEAREAAEAEAVGTVEAEVLVALAVSSVAQKEKVMMEGSVAMVVEADWLAMAAAGAVASVVDFVEVIAGVATTD